MTYRNRNPWMSAEDLALTKTVGERVRYVRENLVDEEGAAITQVAFAKLVDPGARGHHRVMNWEKDRNEPKPEARPKIAAAATEASYPPDLFSLRGAEALVVESAVPLLRSLEEKVEALLTTNGRILGDLDDARTRLARLETARKRGRAATGGSR